MYFLCRFYWCSLTESSCASLASALTFNPSQLKELDVGYNKDLKDSAVERLCEALQRPDCGLQTLGSVNDAPQQKGSRL